MRIIPFLPASELTATYCRKVVKMSMKFVIAKVLLIITALPALSQNSATTSESNVEILSKKWTKIAVLQGPDRRDRRVFDPHAGLPQTRESRMSRGTRYLYE